MINQNITQKFLQLISEKMQTTISNYKYSYGQNIILWDQPYIYEDVSDNSLHITPGNESESIAYKVDIVCQQEEFIQELNKFKLKPKIYKHLIYIPYDISEDQSEFENILKLTEHIKIIHHTSSYAAFPKLSIKLDGKLLLRPDREYWINFINTKEYVVHVYQVDPRGKREQMLFYVIIPIP